MNFQTFVSYDIGYDCVYRIYIITYFKSKTTFMSNNKNENKYWLKRTIPPAVKQNIRQRDWFWCVICWDGIIEYEHIIPEFCDAKEHNPECMTILCSSCHSKVTRKIYSKKKVTKAMKDPCCLKKWFSRDFFDFCDESPKITFAWNTFINCATILQVWEHKVLSIRADLDWNWFLLSWTFFDANWKKSLEIDTNEWIAYTSNRDVVTKWSQLTIYNTNTDWKKNITLQLRATPPNILIVEKIDMMMWNFYCKGDQNELKFSKDWKINMCTFNGCWFKNLQYWIFVKTPWLEYKPTSVWVMISL